MRIRNKIYINPEEPFESTPNLRCKESLIKDNYDDYFINDSFEVYYSYQNYNEIMIVSPTKDNEIRIMRLKDKKIIKILKGHSSLNYKTIFSAILIFDNRNDYIITSTYNNDNLAEDFTKIFLFDGRFVRNIPDTNKNQTYYLLEWNNPNNNQTYIIDFCVGKILINNVNEEEIYTELKSKVNFEQALTYYRGCIIGENNDNLCGLLENGYIHLWNLISFDLISTIRIEKGKLNNLLKWSNRYIIVSDKNDNSFYVIDIIIKQILSKCNKHNNNCIKSLKKIIHPTYKECMITCNHSHDIQLWILSQNYYL